jgi:tetratricopeptide (TPR) repeat protein
MDDQHAERRNGLSATLEPKQTAMPRTPYPGLRPFEPEEWMIFFGREVMIADVIERLARQHLVFIHGASGSGKSSLVRAGVLPKLARQQSRQGRLWTTAIMRPSGGPLWNLASELARLEGRPGEVDRIGEILRLFNRRDASLAAIVAGLDGLAGADICLLIDQFEELFRFEAETSREEAELFISLLIDLIPGEDGEARAPEAGDAPPAPESNLYVIITMRSEFLGECARFDRFAEAINRAQYLVPRLTRASLTRSICYPARNYGGTVTQELADCLIAEVRGKPDELPLIQHGLMVLWNEATKAPADGKFLIDRPLIDALGGLTKCLSDHAEEVLLSAAPDEARMHGAERMFRALTETNAEGQVIRRPLAFGELVTVAGIPAADVHAIIDAFRADGVCFLTPYLPSPIEDRTVIDISHEALIRCWQRLHDWVKKEVAAAEKYGELERRAGQWSRRRNEVLAGDELREYLSWWEAEMPTAPWAMRHGKDFDLVQKFLTASQAEEERQESRQKRKKFLWGAAAAFAVIAIVGGGFYVHEEKVAAAVADKAKLLADDTAAASAYLAKLQAEDVKQRGNFGAGYNDEKSHDYHAAMKNFRQAITIWPDPVAILSNLEIGRLTACIDSADIWDQDQCSLENQKGLPNLDAALAIFKNTYQTIQSNAWTPQQQQAWGINGAATLAWTAWMQGESAYLAGMIYYRKGDVHDARIWFEKAEKPKPKWIDARNNVTEDNAYYLDGVMEGQGGGAGKSNAMVLLEHASRGGFFQADTAIGDLDEQSGNANDADYHYTKALRAGLASQEGSITAAYHLGVDCLYSGHNGCATAIATEDSNIVDANQQPDYHFAMFMFRLALAIYQNPAKGGASSSDTQIKADAEYQIGNLLYDNRDFKPDHVQALAFLQNAIRDNSGYVDAANMKIGLIYGIGGAGVRKDPSQAAFYFNAAIKHAEKEIAADPKDGGAMDQLSQAYLLSGQWQNALDAANSAIAQAPMTVSYQKEKALALMMLGDDDAAMRIFRENRGHSDDGNGVSWRQDVSADVDTLQKLGYQTPLMAQVRNDFGA